MDIRWAMARTVLGRVTAHPDCPISVLQAWKTYQEYWPNGHWEHYPHTRSSFWDEVLKEWDKHADKISEILCTENG